MRKGAEAGSKPSDHTGVTWEGKLPKNKPHIEGRRSPTKVGEVFPEAKSTARKRSKIQKKSLKRYRIPSEAAQLRASHIPFCAKPDQEGRRGTGEGKSDKSYKRK